MFARPSLLVLVLSLSTTGCGRTAARTEPVESGNARSSSPPGAPPQSHPAFGGAAAECEAGRSLERCLRDTLRSMPGQERSVALLDAAIRRDQPGGSLELALALERAHAGGDDAAWLAAFFEVKDALPVLAASSNFDSTTRTEMLARSLPSPCPRLSQSVPTMEAREQVAALSRVDGPCALACPEARLGAGTAEPEAIVVRACGPQFLGLTRAEDAVFFAADPETLLAVRGITHTLEALRRLRGPEDQEPPEWVRPLLEGARSALEQVEIAAHLPATLTVDGAPLRLPTSSAGAEGLAPLLVVLGTEHVYVVARPWIGVDGNGALVRRGDAIPGAPVSRVTEPLDAVAIGRALDDALDRVHWVPPPPSSSDEEAPQWIGADGEVVPSGPPVPVPLEVEIVADADTPLGRIAALLAALDAARPIRAAEPERVRIPMAFLRVRVPGRAGGADATARVRLMPRIEGAPEPRRRTVLTATGSREASSARPSSLGAGSEVEWWRQAERRVSAAATLPLARLLDALGETSEPGEVVELAVVAPE